MARGHEILASELSSQLSIILSIQLGYLRLLSVINKRLPKVGLLKNQKIKFIKTQVKTIKRQQLNEPQFAAEEDRREFGQAAAA